MTSYLRFFFMLPYECRYFPHEIHNKSKMVRSVNFLFDLMKLASCNRDKVLRETLCSPYQSQTMLLMSHFVMYRTLGWEVRKICLICCGCNEDPPITVTPLHIHAHKAYKEHTLQQHCHINTCSNARPQFWELCNSATYYPNIQSAWCVSEVSNWTQLKVGQFKNADNSAL